MGKGLMRRGQHLCSTLAQSVTQKYETEDCTARHSAAQQEGRMKTNINGINKMWGKSSIALKHSRLVFQAHCLQCAVPWKHEVLPHSA